MKEQEFIHYARISDAIQFIREHYHQQPSLGEIASSVHLSPMYLQRLFTEWVGTSPTQFLRYISLEHAKKALKQYQLSLESAAYEIGLSGTGRLHHLFVSIVAMTPAEYKHGGKSLAIHYSFAETKFGNIIVATTTRGVCYLTFQHNENEAFAALQNTFPNAQYQQLTNEWHAQVIACINHSATTPQNLRLHLKGTAFQLQVWEALLKIPEGALCTYGDIAAGIGNGGASRAVGTAIGSNPVAYLIPCHRVIRQTGEIGGYMWGTERKTAIIGWEMAQTDLNGLG